MSKVHPVRSHSNAAAGGINAALNPDDSWESHAFDTVKGSDYLGDQDAIEVMCREAPDEVLWLEHQGVTFHRNPEGRLGTRAFGGASAARTYYVADITGQALLHVLYEQLMKVHEQVDRYEEWFVTALVQDDAGECCGAIARNIRDGVSRAEQTEINEGRGFPDGTVALDITKVPRKRTLEALREIVNIGRDFAGVDITREPIHIKPGCHYIMGGVKTDVWGATDIPGLYAAGEVACVSVHGGNRLGANSLLDTLIFGRRAGEHAANRAKRTDLGVASRAILADEERQISDIIGRERGTGRRISEIKLELGQTMDKHVSVFREKESIETALEVVKRLKEELKTAYIDDRGTIFNQDVLGAIELGFMLDSAECTCMGALHREESRGAQFRTDYPERNDDAWLKHIDLTLNGDGPEISYSEVKITDWQ